jgi:hypothetical protein
MEAMTRTNAFTLLSMLIRAIVLWAAAGLLIGLPAAMYAVRSNQFFGTDSNYWPTMLALACIVLLLALAWLFADKIARLALVRPRDQVFESTMEPQAWLGLAISVIGAWYFFGGLKDLGYLLPRWFIYSRAPGPVPTEAWEQIIPDLFAIIVELVLASIFLLRGTGLARLIQRLRYGESP